MKKLIALTLALAPLSAFAQQLNNFDDLTGKATNIGNVVVVLLISFSVIWIVVNVVRYLIAGGEEDRKKGGMAILWGVVGLFVILSIWGLVAILKNTFSTNNNVDTSQFPMLIAPPTIGGNGGRYGGTIRYQQPGYPADYDASSVDYDNNPWVDEEEMSTYDPSYDQSNFSPAYPQSGN